MEFPLTLPIWWMGSKYLVALAGIWLTVHFMLNGRFKPEPDPVWREPWLNRHPWAMIGMLTFVAGLILFMFTHLKQPYEDRFIEFFLASAFLHTWPPLVLLVVGATLSAIMYRRRQFKVAGAVSFATIMLAGLVVPYYTLPLLL